MTERPLMPVATAVWLIDNTALTFDQIAGFCALHPLQVKGIADGDVENGVRGIDPVVSGQLARAEIDRGEADPAYHLRLSGPKTVVRTRARKRPRYTPISKRQNRPDAIAWMVRHHPEVPDSRIAKLLGTTKVTIQSIRDRSHWNAANLQPQDPVGLGLCTQIALDAVIRKSESARPKDTPADSPEAEPAPSVSPLSPESVFASEDPPVDDTSPADDFDPDQVFAKLEESADSGRD